MTIVRFQPKREDGRPEWQLIYEVLVDGDGMVPGDLLHYEALDEIVGRDFRRNRGPIYRAMAEFEKTHQRTLRPVPARGYEVVEGQAQAVLAQSQARKGQRRIHRGATLASTTRREGMTYDQIKRVDALQLAMEHWAHEMRRIEQRVDRIEAKPS